MLLALLANIHRADRTTTYRPEDFMPHLSNPEEPATTDDTEDDAADFDPGAASAVVAKMLGIKD